MDKKGKMKNIIWAPVALALSLVSAQASATVIIEIDRLSDTQGVLTASGTLDDGPVPMNGYILSLSDPFGIAPAGYENQSILGPSSMEVDGNPITFGYDLGPDFYGEPGIYFGTSTITFWSGSTFSGSLNLTLGSGRTWDAIGSSGSVYWGMFAQGLEVGTWLMTDSTVTSVPEPGTTALLGMGLLGIAFVRRRRAA